MVAGLAPVVTVLVLISAIIDLYCVLKRCVTAAPVDVSRGDPLSRGLYTLERPRGSKTATHGLNRPLPTAKVY